MTELPLQEHERLHLSAIALKSEQCMSCIGVAKHVRMHSEVRSFSNVTDNALNALSIIGVGLTKLIQKQWLCWV